MLSINNLIAISLVIPFIDLVGLFTVTLAKRAKEIGIRKVRDASVSCVVVLLSKYMVQLVGFA
jgi:hypothetical protein